MKTLQCIVEQEWQTLTDNQVEWSVQELASNVTKRLSRPIDQEIVRRACEAFVESKIKALPDHDQMLLAPFEWVEQELKSGNTRIGKSIFRRNDKLTYKHLSEAEPGN